MERTGVAAWDPVEIPARRCAAWHFPGRRIWVERVEREWHVLSLPAEEPGASERAFTCPRSRKPRSSEWRHYLHESDGPVVPAPVLPDRPLVVRPDRALTLLPGQRALFFLELPVWFRLSTAGALPARIFEEPLSPLSRTWFGDAATGELCWGRSTRMHHSMDSVKPSASMAVCPLAVQNDSAGDLPFEKICIHVENLSVFRGARRLWTNGLTALFKGPDQATQIEIAGAPSSLEEGLVPASAAREQLTGWSIRRTFGALKSFTDI